MRLVPPYIETLEPYKAGKPISELKRELGLTDVIKLASNENPLGPSPVALEELRKVMNDLHYYPNGGLDLREVLAERFDLKVANVIVDAGSEGIMSSIIRTFLCDDDEVLTSEGTFVGLYVLVKSRGVRLVTVPLKEYHFDLKAIAAAITGCTKIIYLANPNNPTGTIFTKSEFDEFMNSVPSHVLIILDEAYFEYAKDNPKYPDSMHYRYDNVITLRTFSKVYGLAGIRIGYGFAHETLIGNLLKVKLPFEPSTLAQAAGIGALRDATFVHRSLEVNAEGMQYVVPELKELGFTVIPSDANFVMCPLESSEAVTELYTELLKLGVIIRPLPAFRLPHCIRITIGTMPENERLIQSLKTIKSPATEKAGRLAAV
jgi:histidinol-phosphate aminotransferase